MFSCLNVISSYINSEAVAEGMKTTVLSCWPSSIFTGQPLIVTATCSSLLLVGLDFVPIARSYLEGAAKASLKTRSLNVDVCS